MKFWLTMTTKGRNLTTPQNYQETLITLEFVEHQRKVIDIWYDLNIIEREVKSEVTSNQSNQ